MAEVTLLPGAVFTPTAGELGDIPPVGDPPQWADDDDATYAITANEDAVISPRAYLEPFTFSEPPTSVVYHARASTADLNPFSVGIISDDFSVFMTDTGLALEAQATGTPSWFASDPAEIPDPSAFAVASEAGALKVFASQLGTGGAGSNRTTIYEAYLVVTYGGTLPPTIKPATRLHPRDDNLGLGSPRLYPLPKAVGRVVGGYQ